MRRLRRVKVCGTHCSLACLIDSLDVTGKARAATPLFEAGDTESESEEDAGRYCAWLSVPRCVDYLSLLCIVPRDLSKSLSTMSIGGQREDGAFSGVSTPSSH